MVCVGFHDVWASTMCDLYGLPRCVVCVCVGLMMCGLCMCVGFHNVVCMCVEGHDVCDEHVMCL